MFSCCRTNSKNSKTIKKDNKSVEGESNDENSDKRVIPTITIDRSGKTNGNNDENVHNNGNGTVSETAAANDSPVKEAEVAVKIKATDTSATTGKYMPESRTEIAPATEASADAIVENDQSDDRSKSTPTSNTDDSTQTTINRASATIANDSSSSNAVTQNHQQLQQLGQQTTSVIAGDSSNCAGDSATASSSKAATPAKSCLSRHNSTHTSTKKKVNISTHAEIIEPDPLPPPAYDHSSLGGDDDDVFSDSLPPQKRESMCAPYIERDELPDTAAFAHGLPEWFNDERINDMNAISSGCIEPPVTPVGRDELEMKRQRLYADLLRAAHAAVEHNVRFTPFIGEYYTTHQQYQQDVDGRTGVEGACDPDLKPSIAENLEHLVNRLEKLVERLERSISARELEIANRTFNVVVAKKRESFDLETTELPPLPVESISQQLSHQTDHLNERIERIESTLNKINDRHSSSLSTSISQNSQHQQSQSQQLQLEGSLENIPTVLEDYQSLQSNNEEEPVSLPPPPKMSVLGYQDIINGPLSQYLALSAKIGGDVAKHAALVKAAFDAQLQYVTLATQCAQPSQDKQMELLKPTSAQISAVQDFREKNRASLYFNHLSAISESIPALGWVCVSPTPGPHVKEMNDAGQFYTNRVLKEWKEKDPKHVEWARAWIQTLTELQAYIKQYHTTGLVWSGKGGAPARAAGVPPPPPMGPPPPPPPAFDLAAMSLEGGGSADERSALFAEINQGEAITKNLKKVTADMQTHKNPTLRTGPAPFKKPTQFGSVGSAPTAPTVKDPVFTRDGKKWLIEYQRNNTGLLVDNAEMNNVVYVFKCEGSTLTVKGKVNNIVLDSCKKCSLLFDSVVASIEFVNCQSVQMQVLGFVPTISIDKTDGCQMYLSKESLGVEIVSSKSSEMNVMLPEANGDYIELAVPEQFKTTISGNSLRTVCVDSLG